MLFDLDDVPVRVDPIGDGAVVLRGFARQRAGEIISVIEHVACAAPFRHMVTPNGQRMSVAMTNCGALGWISDLHGYRYGPTDPVTGSGWPVLPVWLARFAAVAANSAGYPGFEPDACLINRYEPGARLSLHQDRNERNNDHPIVSVSIGLPALFLWGGLRRDDPVRRVPLLHGDVAIWGRSSRLAFHGLHPLRDGWHERTGRLRYNLTFRTAG